MDAQSGQGPIRLKVSAVITGVCIWLCVIFAVLLVLSSGLPIKNVGDALVAALLIAVFLPSGVGIVWAFRYRVVFEAEQVRVRRLFTEKTYAYCDLNAVIRRGRRSLGARPKVADVSKSMVVLYQGKKAVLELDLMILGPMGGVHRAVEMIKTLDIPKTYL